MNTARNYLIALANKHNGDWHRMYADIQARTYEDLDLSNSPQQAITILDEGYPECLKRTPQTPLVLFYKGDISLIGRTDSVAIIGSRNPKGENEIFTDTFIRSTLASDRVIITTLARGIGATATLSALESGHKVIAVLGSGIDYCYPQENKDLYDRIIAEGGLVLSEYPFCTLPESIHFAARNRIVVGLAESVCSIETNKMSGTAMTLCMACNENKEVYVKPDLDNPEDFNNQLIEEGANCLTLSTAL